MKNRIGSIAFLLIAVSLIVCCSHRIPLPSGSIELKAVGGLCALLLCEKKIEPNAIGQLDVVRIVQAAKNDPDVLLGLPLEERVIDRWFKAGRLIDWEYRDYSVSIFTNSDTLYLSVVRAQPGLLGGIISSNWFKVDCVVP